MPNGKELTREHRNKVSEGMKRAWALRKINGYRPRGRVAKINFFAKYLLFQVFRWEAENPLQTEQEQAMVAAAHDLKAVFDKRA